MCSLKRIRHPFAASVLLTVFPMAGLTGLRAYAEKQHPASTNSTSAAKKVLETTDGKSGGRKKETRPSTQARSAKPSQKVQLESKFVAQRVREVYLLDVVAPGKVLITATWQGDSRLALILNGPGQVGYYARKDGTSPLSIEFDVKRELMPKDTKWRVSTQWRVSIINFSRRGPVSGSIKISYPGEAKKALKETTRKPEKTSRF